VDSGVHPQAPTGGDGGREGAALSCAQANARREECVGHRAGLMARMHARWLGRLGPGALGATRGHRDGVRTVRSGRRQRGRAGARPSARPRGPTRGPRRDGVRTAVWTRRVAPVRRRRRDDARRALRCSSPVSICYTDSNSKT
jgi:hypothetical protein